MNGETEIQLKYTVENEKTSDGRSVYSIICSDKNGKIIFKTSDITSDKIKAEDFCELLNRNSVSVVHFCDVLEDYFYC
ncbi:MAG: lipocalin/fatty-acid binding family protein [Clostridia bacterium]|nr:lipocalin/fatty-acid binding family protein [Clostridia bacterium]